MAVCLSLLSTYSELFQLKMKGSSFITYLILFFSGIFIVIMIYFAINILIINIVKSNYIASKHSAEFFANTLNSLFSSTANVSLIVTLPKINAKFYFFEDNVTVKIGNDVYSEKIFKPDYIELKVKNNPITARKEFQTQIFITKINNEIKIE